VNSADFDSAIRTFDPVRPASHALVPAERCLASVTGQIKVSSRFGVFGQLRSTAGDVKYVDRLLPFRRDQHQVDVDPVLRDDAADTMQQPWRVIGHELEHRIPLRVRVVHVDHRRAAHHGRAAEQDAPLLVLEHGAHVRMAGHGVPQRAVELLARLRVPLEEAVGIRELN